MTDASPEELRAEKEGTTNLRGVPIQIRVGSDPNTEDFHVHEHVLIAQSDFFKAALRKDWKEGQQRVISLPLDEPEAFHIYVKYTYTSSLHLDDIQVHERNMMLCQLYCLGERLLDATFQDTVLDAVVFASRVRDPASGHRRAPLKPDKVNLIYDGTPPGSPMRKLLVDMAVCCGNGGWDIENQDPPYHGEFLAQLCTALMVKRRLVPEEAEQFRELVEGSPVSYHKFRPKDDRQDEDRACEEAVAKTCVA